eukprot:6198970-Pleurochrysis_carterae.AAC.3
MPVCFVSKQWPFSSRSHSSPCALLGLQSSASPRRAAAVSRCGMNASRSSIYLGTMLCRDATVASRSRRRRRSGQTAEQARTSSPPPPPPPRTAAQRKNSGKNTSKGDLSAHRQLKKRISSTLTGPSKAFAASTNASCSHAKEQSVNQFHCRLEALLKVHSASVDVMNISSRWHVAHVLVLWCALLVLLYREASRSSVLSADWVSMVKLKARHADSGTGGSKGASDADVSGASLPGAVNADAAAVHDVCCVVEPALHFSSRVVLGDGAVVSAMPHVAADGTFALVAAASAASAKAYATLHQLLLHDHSPHVISPGLVDVHVHISAVGGRGWEGYASATAAAAAGGVTTIIGMPLNSLPPMVDTRALRLERQAAAAEGLLVDVGLWAGVVPSSLESGDLNELLADPHVLGVKAFLSPLPPAAGYAALTVDELERAARIIAPSGLPLLVHAELMSRDEMAVLEAEARASSASRRFSTFLATRPALFEKRAISSLIALGTALPQLRVHVVHLSDSESLPMLTAAKAARNSANVSSLTVETCPHYLRFAAEEVPDGETRLKCVPPIRSRMNREALWAGLLRGEIDMLASDHSPCAPQMRALHSGDFLQARAAEAAAAARRRRRRRCWKRRRTSWEETEAKRE